MSNYVIKKQRMSIPNLLTISSHHNYTKAPAERLARNLRAT